MKNVLLARSGEKIMDMIQVSLESYLPETELDVANAIPDMHEKLAAKQYEVLIFDLSLEAERMAGTLLEVITKKDAPKALAYCPYEEASIATLLYRAGLKGFISGIVDLKELLMAVQTVFEGKIYLSPAMQVRLLDKNTEEAPDADFSVLSEIELRILMLLLREERVVDISSQLELSAGTISNMKKRILKKLSILSLSDARRILYGSFKPDVRSEN